MKTIVIGSGVVGTTTAYFLAKNGHEVTLIDRQQDAAEETSFGNGGVLHSSEAEPWARPGMPRKIIGWLGKEDAPLLLRWSAIPHMWRWGLAFAAACTPERYRKATEVNLRLTFYTLRLIAEIRAEAGMQYDMLQGGAMKVYTKKESLDVMAAESAAMKPYGIAFEIASPARCVEIEPALKPIEHTLAGGLYYPPDETGDCSKFTKALARHAATLGVKLQYGTTAQRLVRNGGRIEALETDKGRFTADNYVVAMASFTPRFLRPLGIRVPIYPVKGVTVTVPAGNWAEGPRIPIIDDSRLFGLIRLGDRYRCSGSAEIAGFDRTPSITRCQALVNNVISVFPKFAECYDPKTALYWAGLRPIAPSGNPYLGATPIPNLFLNAGHGHLGWTMSCGSGKAVADIVAGRTPEIDMTGLTLATHA